MRRYTYLKAGIILSIFCFGPLSGCATVVKGTTQKIPVASDPPGADVIANGQLLGQTPIDITLQRKRDHLVTISKDGYKQKSVAITKSTGGAVWGNIIAGGLIGWGVDASSGAQYNLSPESINLALDPVPDGETATIAGQAEFEFIAKLNELDILKEKGSISDEEYSIIRTSLFREYYPEMSQEVVNPLPQSYDSPLNNDVIDGFDNVSAADENIDGGNELTVPE